MLSLTYPDPTSLPAHNPNHTTALAAPGTFYATPNRVSLKLESNYSDAH